MDKVIAEVVIGVLFLSILLTVIPMYRENNRMVAEMVSQADYNEKIKEMIKPDIPDGQWASGSEVIAAIRFYALYGNTKLTVNTRNGAKTYFETDYNEESFKINRAKEYYVMYVYTDEITKIIFYEGV